MNIEFYIDNNPQMFPEIFIKGYENDVLIKDYIDINLYSMIDLIPKELVVEYRDLLKNKILTVVSENHMWHLNMHLERLSFISNYLEEHS